jgi:3-oxoacyl-[acyl-carrier-protein] synthase III
MRRPQILGVGYAVPNNRVSNEDLAQVMDTNDVWITERTGIKTRYFSKEENTSDLAVRAAILAIEDACIDPTLIDCIIVATLTPDAMMPCTAALVQAKLKLSAQRMMVFDLNGACSGFLLALQTVDALIQSGQVNTALIIGSETLSKILDYTDRGTAVLFGDGAGAFLVSHSQGKPSWTHFVNTQGDLEDTLSTDGLSLNASLRNIQGETPYLRMKGQAVFRFAIRAVEDAITQVLLKSHHQLDEIDLIIPHQANARILGHVSEKMNFPLSKFVMNMDEFGNTSSASIPIAFAQAKAKGLIHKDMKILLVGFGAGLIWASTLIEL